MSFRYIQAATSPKDIIIVVDISGSMKGLKLTIAKHTINTILDTLGENDFVNIIAVLRLFGNSAVPARSNCQTIACHYLCVIYPAVHRLCPVCGAMFSRHARAGGSGQPGGMFEL